ncbi:MAG: glycerol-3-phosphate acyltransferase, partial [Fimbriimonadales bacterium]|nr:glycerol-3-phosphate acyltransferase [Fimbriimonadales bacterium]
AFVVMQASQNDAHALLTGAAAILGHTFSPFMGFRGGKGIATGLGVLLAAAPKTAAIAFLVWLIAFLFTRWVSLGSILGAATVPIAAYGLGHSPAAVAILAVAAAVVIWRHRANIGRILRGQEPRFTWRRAEPSLEQACLELARMAVERFVLEGALIEPDLKRLPRTLRERGSVFVALYQGEQLRGLMGSLQPQKPTRAHEIIHHATRAALLDPHRPPVEADELPTLRYVVYLVESYEPLRDSSQVDPQRDAVLVEWQGRAQAIVPPMPDVRTPQEQIERAFARGGIPREAATRIYRVRLSRLG